MCPWGGGGAKGRSVDEEHFAVFGEWPAVVVDEGFEGVGGLAEGGHGGKDGGGVVAGEGGGEGVGARLEGVEAGAEGFAFGVQGGGAGGAGDGGGLFEGVEGDRKSVV